MERAYIVAGKRLDGSLVTACKAVGMQAVGNPSLLFMAPENAREFLAKLEDSYEEQGVHMKGTFAVYEISLTVEKLIP